MSNETTIEPVTMRSVLGRFCTGVVIVTAEHDGEPAGFTAQSFTSLSLDPPLVSVCVAATSSTYPRLRAAGRFCVNVLGEQQEDLSGRFASRQANRFEGVDHRPAPATGSPILEGALAWIDCELVAEHEAGDHVIVVAQVLDLGAPERGPRPLLFYRGAYSGLRR